MAFKLFVLLGVVSGALSQHYGAPASHGYAEPEVYAHPKYSFEYEVKDEHTGDIKSQHEERDGDVVKGYYSLLEADGTKRTVEYSADHKNGFNAIVHKEGTPKYPEPKKYTPSYHAAPVVHAAAPVVHAAAPVVHAAVPVVHAAVPVVHAAPVYHAPAHVYHAITPVHHAPIYTAHKPAFASASVTKYHSPKYISAPKYHSAPAFHSSYSSSHSTY